MDLARALAENALLRAELEVREQQLAARDAALATAHFELQLARFEIARLRKLHFGDRSERAVPGQDTLPGLELARANDNDNAKPTPPARTKPGRRSGPREKPNSDPLTLREGCYTTKHVHLTPEQTSCSCCGELLTAIGEELSRRVERIPAHFLETIFHRVKLACARCRGAGVKVAPAPEPAVTGAGPVGVSLAVDLALGHYCDHLPFHRLAGIFHREGLSLARSTLSRVSARVALQLGGIVDAMENALLGGDDVVGLDGTGLRILASPHCERRVVYVLHGGGHLVFRMLAHGGAEAVLEGFETFRGTMLCDAASVHLGNHSQSLGLAIALCNAHARRKFFEARETEPTRVGEALAFYREVALAERRWSTLTPLERQRARSLELRPRFDAFQQWLQRELARTPPRTPLRQAIEYALRHWEGLSRFLEDGRIPWTNNESERHLRHLAVGRHAWLFRGSEKGAEHACVLWSLMLGCKQHGLDPRRYLLDTLEALGDTLTSRLLELTPKAYAERQQQRRVA